MGKLVMERHVADNKYLHRDFHVSCDQGIAYVGENFGDDSVVDYLSTFAHAYYKPLIEKINENGLVALKNHIENIYAAEEATDAVKTELRGDFLSVEIAYCPAVSYMNSIGHTPSKWYIETTRTVNRVIANETGYDFTLSKYEGETGRASYQFKRRTS